MKLHWFPLQSKTNPSFFHPIFVAIVNKIVYNFANLWKKLQEICQIWAFWAAAPKGRCPVEHRGEFRDVRPSVLPSVLPSFHPSVRPSVHPSAHRWWAPVKKWENKHFRSFLGSGPKGPMSCRTQGGISRCPSVRPSVLPSVLPSFRPSPPVDHEGLKLALPGLNLALQA